jgi:uncharacterized membrane protein YdjX (TVP38/TMEM64 family)
MSKKQIFHLIETLTILVVLFFLIANYLNFNQLELFILEKGNYSYFVFFLVFIILTLLGIGTFVLIVLASLLFSIEISILLSWISLITASLIAYFSTIFIEHKYIKKHHIAYQVKIHFLEVLYIKIKKKFEKEPIKTIFIAQTMLYFVPSCYILGLINKKISHIKIILITIVNALIHIIFINLFTKVFIELDKTQIIVFSLPLIFIYVFFTRHKVSKILHNL